MEAIPFGRLGVLGEVGGLLLCRAADGVVGIHLENACRMVAYARLSSGLSGQTLVPPVTMELSPLEVDRFLALRGLLLEVGMEVECFGGQTFVVQTAPQGIRREDVAETARALLALRPREGVTHIDALFLELARFARAPLVPTEHVDILEALDDIGTLPQLRPKLYFWLGEGALWRLLK